MPILRENRGRYPENWPEISWRIRVERARNRCEECGVKNGALGGRAFSGTFLEAWPKGEKLLRHEWPEPGEWWWCGPAPGRVLRIFRIVLTVAHLDHIPENCADENLRALCQRCHNRYDVAHRRTTRWRRRGAGTLDLFAGAVP